MKIINILSAVLISVAATAITGCDSYDDRYIDEYASVVRLKTYGQQTITVPAEGPAEELTVEVLRSGHDIARNSKAQLRAMSDEEWQSYARTYGLSRFHKIPDGSFSFPNNGVIDFAPGQISETASVMIEPAQIKAFKNTLPEAEQKGDDYAHKACLPLVLEAEDGSVFADQQNLLFVMNVALGAGDILYDDDFSWCNSPLMTTNVILHQTANEKNNAFLPATILRLGIQNPGWQQATFTLNEDHTQRLAPDPGVDPTNFFDHPENAVYMRPGYLKIGNSNFAGALVTPAKAMEQLGNQTADIEVTFRMCSFSSPASATKAGDKDARNVYVGIWDGCQGEVADADYDQVANGWTYKCKWFDVANYYQSLFMEYGPDYDAWSDDLSLYTMRVNGVNAGTRLFMFFGGYGAELGTHTTPTTITLIINGKPMTFPYKANRNRIALKGCTMRILNVRK